MANFNVVAEETVQVLVEDTIDLFTPAQKIDQIVARVENLRCHIIPDKVIFQAVLHKQIFLSMKKTWSFIKGRIFPSVVLWICRGSCPASAASYCRRLSSSKRN